MPKPSQRLRSYGFLADAEFMEWCSLAIFLWQTDAQIHSEFSDVVVVLDWIVEVAERLIRSA